MFQRSPISGANVQQAEEVWAEQNARASKDKGKGRLETLVPRCRRCESRDLVCEILVGGKLTSCEECKGVKGRCERPGEEKAPKWKRKVVEEQDRPWKKQRLEDVLELGSVQPWGMPDWTKLFGGIVDTIKSLEATVKVQNQCLHHQNLILEDLIHLKAEEIYGEDLPEGLEGIPDVETEEVMGLADERREVVKVGMNVELGSSGSSPEEDEKEEEGEESESGAEGSEA